MLTIEEILILRCICGVTMEYEIRHEHIRSSIKVALIMEKIRDNR